MGENKIPKWYNIFLYFGSQSFPSQGIKVSVGCLSYFMQRTADSLKCLQDEHSVLLTTSRLESIKFLYDKYAG
jgi:hypothetical protein